MNVTIKYALIGGTALALIGLAIWGWFSHSDKKEKGKMKKLEERLDRVLTELEKKAVCPLTEPKGS